MKSFFHVGDIGDLGAALEEAKQVKATPYAWKHLGENKTIMLVFFNSSLRTRLSSQKAAINLGMSPIVLNIGQDSWKLETEMGVVMDGDKSEHLREAIPVMTSYCDLIGIRSFAGLTDREFDYNETVLKQFIEYGGKPVIRDSTEYRALKETLRDATGSGVVIVRDGLVPTDFSAYSPWRHPRNVVGYTADGKTLYFMIVDGRQPTWSEGMLYEEMGEIMKSLGCVWSSNLDGGGSAQLVIRHPTAETWQLRNRACDDLSGIGTERAVVSCWMVTVDEP